MIRTTVMTLTVTTVMASAAFAEGLEKKGQLRIPCTVDGLILRGPLWGSFFMLPVAVVK